ncbi:MAG: hypothetical protein NZZ41_07405 [Candidatus Dojkabacteria bacterium]|nr:hypothetical protein [Candidatus Dojkabacteria bacterium]
MFNNIKEAENEFNYIVKYCPQYLVHLLGVVLYTASRGHHPFLAAAQAFQESRFDPTKKNKSSTALGILQQLNEYICENGPEPRLLDQAKINDCKINPDPYTRFRRTNPAHACELYCRGMEKLWKFALNAKMDDYQDIVFRYAMGVAPVRKPDNAQLYDHYMRYTYELFNFSYPVVVKGFFSVFGNISNFNSWIDKLNREAPEYIQENDTIPDRSKWKKFFFDTNRYPVPVFGYTENEVKALDPTWKRCAMT